MAYPNNQRSSLAMVGLQDLREDERAEDPMEIDSQRYLEPLDGVFTVFGPNCDIPVRLDLEDVPLGFRHITSYNWLKTDRPTILLPGAPPSWSPPDPAEKFALYHGKAYIDENAALLPHYPLEPVFRALQILAPTETVSDMDLITCETTIEKLLKFVLNECDGSYRFDVEIVGKTAIFTRMEEEHTETISEFSGYRVSLLEKQTKWDSSADQSQSHYRIAKCVLDDVQCLLRYRGQAYIPGERQASSTVVESQSERSEPEDDGVFHCIPTYPGNRQHSPLEVRFGGKEIPQRRMARILTGNDTKSESIFDIPDMPLLWLTDTPTLIKAPNEQGIFKKVEAENVEKMTMAWLQERRTSIGKLAKLITGISNIAKETATGKCWVEIVGSLGVYVKAPTNKMGLMSLPADIKEIMFGIPDLNKPTPKDGNVGPSNTESPTGQPRVPLALVASGHLALSGVPPLTLNSPLFYTPPPGVSFSRKHQLIIPQSDAIFKPEREDEDFDDD